ncbi:MAG: hypothetical protein JST17_00185 [Bacteroidetes bacterium]|nr:hypothetical protein [Bacteroidota bacterium]MBS1932233.1 hypothetical protein [Bacteroidota bacterium]
MKALKQRITRGWNWIRSVYLVIGIGIMIQSIVMYEWMGVLFGGWITAMGLFGLGCASGACFINNHNPSTDTKNNLSTTETDPVQNRYEEINVT